MRVLTWNVNRATESRTGLWEMVQRENADIVFLQEVNRIPDSILNQYRCHLIRPRYFNGNNTPYSSAVLSKGTINTNPYLKSDLEWINKIHETHYGWIIDCEISLSSTERFMIVAVYIPPYPIPRNWWAEIDVSCVKLTQNPDIWFTEILWRLLCNASISTDTNWIVGGDFNTSVLLDIPNDRGNREIINRINSLGLIDCLSHYHHGPVASYMHTNKVVEHQLDYVYVNAKMLKRLKQVRVPRHEDVFAQNPRLSDHLPILCEFD